MSGHVWASRLDEKYDVVVTRDPENDYKATLRISEGDQVLLEESVGLSYGAIFGPDVDDVGRWMDRSVEFVDGLGKEKA